MASPEQCVELVKSESLRIQQYLTVLSAEDMARPSACAVSYTHLTLPTNREV